MGSTQTLPGLRASARSPQGLCSGCCSVDLHPLQASLALDTPQPPMDGSTGGASSLPDHVFSSGPLFLRPSSILGVAAQGSAALEPGPSHHLTCAALPALTIPGVPLARARQGPVPLVQGPWVPPAGSTVPQELLEPPRHCSGVIPSLIHVLCHLTAPCVGAGSHSGSDFWDGTGAPGPGAGLGTTCWGSAHLDGAVPLHPGVSHPSIPQFTSTPLPGSPPGHQGAPAEGGRATAAPCPPSRVPSWLPLPTHTFTPCPPVQLRFVPSRARPKRGPESRAESSAGDLQPPLLPRRLCVGARALAALALGSVRTRSFSGQGLSAARVVQPVAQWGPVLARFHKQRPQCAFCLHSIHFVLQQRLQAAHQDWGRVVPDAVQSVGCRCQKKIAGQRGQSQDVGGLNTPPTSRRLRPGLAFVLGGLAGRALPALAGPKVASHC